jgi:hypothetical protein
VRAQVVRAYGGDASRLLDACRECAVFDGLPGLRAAARAAAADPEARVIRVKNRLDPAYDAAASGG